MMYRHVTDTGQEQCKLSRSGLLQLQKKGSSDTKRTVRCDNMIDRKENNQAWRPGDN